MDKSRGMAGDLPDGPELEDDMDDEERVARLRQWAISTKAAHGSLNSLLPILNQYHNGIYPDTAEDLLMPPTASTTKDPGKY